MSKEVKVVAGAFNKVVLDVVEFAKQGWDIGEGNSITLIGGSMKVLMCKENNSVQASVDVSSKTDEIKQSVTKTSTRKRQTKQAET